MEEQKSTKTDKSVLAPVKDFLKSFSRLYNFSISRNNIEKHTFVNVIVTMFVGDKINFWKSG